MLLLLSCLPGTEFHLLLKHHSKKTAENQSFNGVVKILPLLVFIFFSAFVRADIQVTDDSGKQHRFAQPVQRIVALMPHATELLYAVGAGQQIVGAVDYSDYPPEAKSIPRVGGYSGLNIEAIVALQPDLIVAWPEGNNSRELARLEQLGFDIYASCLYLSFDEKIYILATIIFRYYI